jgi:serine protease
MNRASLTILLGLSLLTACTQMTPPGLSNADVDAAYARSVVYQAPHSGTWSVGSLPAWLSASPSSGSGPVKVTFTVNRTLGAPESADQPKLSGAVTLNWKSGSGSAESSGAATLNVSASLYHLSGQVGQPVVAVSAPPVLSSRAVQVGGEVASRGVIVKYRTPAAAQRALSALGGSGRLIQGQALRLSSRAGLSLTLQTPDVDAALRALRADPGVEYAVPNALLRAQSVQATPPLQAPFVPADEYAPLQYGYRLTGYGAVWRDMQNAPYTRSVTVAVIDSGVRFDHPDLAGRLWTPGEGALDVITSDKFGPDTDPTDPGTLGEDGSHGTHVSGLIAAGSGPFAPPCAGCSGSGVVGAALTAPVKVLPIRAIDSQGNASESNVALAVRYAAGETVTVGGVSYTSAHPAQVINLSLGGAISASTARPLCEAVASATAAGVLVVAAAGNGGGSQPYYPAACPGAVSVAAVRPDPAGLPIHAEYSQHYAGVALAAYGGADPRNATYNMNLKLSGERVADSVFSTSWDYRTNRPSYQFLSGTSQAAPQVAALVALLLSKGTVSTGAQALARMQATATDLGSPGQDQYTGSGVINAAAALGAPAVADTRTLSILGNPASFRPALDAAGRFSAYLPDGSFQVVAGPDSNGNGLGGEVGENGVRQTAILGPDQPDADLGLLQPADR